MAEKNKEIRQRTISIVVDNCAGVLSRVSNLFSRRGFNIDSLAVGTTEKPEFSRITVVVSCDDYLLEQIINQLKKLACVYKVRVLNESGMVMRELVLIKVSANSETRSEIIEIVNVFRARIIDIAPETVTIEITGQDEKTEALLKMLDKFGIIETARTGIVALERGASNIYE